MVICPRCAQLVDETNRATCPHCFTPLTGVAPLGTAPPVQAPAGQSPPGQPPAPQAYAPQMSKSAGTRVSLTGEVIEDSAASAPPPSYVAGGAQARQPMGMAPRPPGSVAARTAYSSRPEASAKSGGGNKVAAMLVAFLVVAGLSVGGWWFLMPHSNPKTVVQQYVKALGAQDWKTLYGLVELPEATKSKTPDAAAFVSEMTKMTDQFRANPLAASSVDSFFKAYETAQVGEPTITGDTAAVPVTVKMSFSMLGKTQESTSTVPTALRKVGGTWKVDWSGNGLANIVPSVGR